MIGLDSNILLRAATGDDPKFTPIARKLIAALSRESTGFINSVVLAEFVWTLGRRYRYKRDEILGVIEDLLRSPAYVVADRDAVNAAISRARAENLHFADAFIGEINLRSGCQTTLTFDDGLSASSAFRDASSSPSGAP